MHYKNFFDNVQFYLSILVVQKCLNIPRHHLAEILRAVGMLSAQMLQIDVTTVISTTQSVIWRLWSCNLETGRSRERHLGRLKVTTPHTFDNLSLLHRSLYRSRFNFMHDNTSPHTASVQDFFCNIKVCVFRWGSSITWSESYLIYTSAKHSSGSESLQ